MLSHELLPHAVHDDHRLTLLHGLRALGADLHVASKPISRRGFFVHFYRCDNTGCYHTTPIHSIIELLLCCYDAVIRAYTPEEKINIIT